MDNIKIATFNVNSIRSRIDIVLDWIEKENCDVLCLQEIKVQDSEFPHETFQSEGLYCAVYGQKAYNGVAIISKMQPDQVFCKQKPDEQEARLIRARFGDINVVNTYVPQGTEVGSARFEYKLEWIRGMRSYFESNFTPEDKVLWVGDLNVAREPIDVYDPEGLAGSVCFHPDEQAALSWVMEWGLIDVFRKHHPGEAEQYSFWDYRIPNAVKRRMGWRLDHILATKPLAELSMDCYIDKEPRMKPKPSDHAPVVAIFLIPEH